MEAAKQAVERKTLDERQKIGELWRLRHSAAHIMATAVTRIWSDARLYIWSPTEDGFYYDFYLASRRFSSEDFPRVEEEMRKVVKENELFGKSIKSRDEAK